VNLQLGNDELQKEDKLIVESAMGLWQMLILESKYVNTSNVQIDKEFDIVVKSFSRNIEFARLDIELPLELVPFYKNTAPSHITLVYTGKASDAGLFEASDITFLNTTIQGTLFTYYS
jgi:hypothetical protein